MSSTEPPDSRLSLAEVEVEFRSFSGADWKRALSLARFCAAGLSDWTAETLVAEALVKLQSGERVWKRGVPPLVTLKTVMRSIASNNRKKARNGPIDQHATIDVGAGETDDASPPGIQAQDTRTPEEIVDERSQLRHIETLVEGDEDAQMVLMAWADGLRGKEAAQELGFDMNRYEAARKRLNTRLASAATLRKTT